MSPIVCAVTVRHRRGYHAASHTLVVLSAATGAVVDNDAFPTTAAGLARVMGWSAQRIDEGSALIRGRGDRLLRRDPDRAPRARWVPRGIGGTFACRRPW